MHKAALTSLLRDRYAAVHGAVPAGDYPAYLTIGVPEAPQAAIGFRRADAGALFLEAYLDRPIEAVLTSRLDRAVTRAQVVELGDHASHRPAATIALWRESAAALQGQAEFAVAVLTRPLRAMFARLGLPLLELAPARIELLGEAGAAWGRYYQTDPVVCAGDITACRSQLARAGRA